MPARLRPSCVGPLLIAAALGGPGRPSGPEDGPGPAPERVEVRGVENVFRLSPNLYSGGEPRGEAALEQLGRLGIRTILSVDGVTPDVEAARKLGIRYVHLPIGYDGVPRGQAVRMARAVRDLPGPVYVHCHHGIHRGPAAAAICGMATEGWSKERAAGWLKVAGTSADYRGLHASVRDFAVPEGKELEAAGDLPERSEVPALAGAMVQVDARWDALKGLQKAGFARPAGAQGPDPAAEALQLLELYREALRLPESSARGSDFLGEMAAAEAAAGRLYGAAVESRDRPSPDARAGLEAAFVAAGKSCKSCHVRHRDR